MATINDFRTRFPEFLCPLQYPDSRIQMFLDDALMDISVPKFGDLADRAQVYLAAHYLALATGTMDGDAGTVGKVSNKSVDGVSVAYVSSTNQGSSGSNQKDIFESTSYGQYYLELVKRVCPGFCTYGVNSSLVKLPAPSGVPV